MTSHPFVTEGSGMRTAPGYTFPFIGCGSCGAPIAEHPKARAPIATPPYCSTCQGQHDPVEHADRLMVRRDTYARRHAR